MEYNYQQIFDPMIDGISPAQIFRIPDGATIPNNLENIDWQAYQEWLAAGNTPLPPA